MNPTCSAIAGIVLACLALPASSASSAQKSVNVHVGAGPLYAALDPVTGRLFTTNAGYGSNGGGLSIGVMYPNGSVTEIPTPAAAPNFVSVSGKFRKAIVTQMGCNCATILDTDTLATTSITAGWGPVRSVVVESIGMAYILNVGWNSGTSATPAVLAFPGAVANRPASITAVDLRTNETHDYPITTFGPVAFAADPSGSRLYIVGTNYYRTGEAKPGFIQAFDTATNSLAGSMVPMGRMARHVNVSADGNEVYVTGHVDFERTNVPLNDMNRFSIRPAVFVLDAASLATKRIIDLPDATNLQLIGPDLLGDSKLDPVADRLYVINRNGNYLAVVDPASGSVRSQDLEGTVNGLGVNTVAKNVVVTMMRLGQAAIFSLDGERLDTVPIGRAAVGSELLGIYSVTVDPASGTAYATNGHDGSIAILRRPEGDAQPAVLNLTDLWFKPSDPGWGVYIEQQGATLFAALFAYDLTGESSWLVMTNGARQPDGSFTGDLYRTKGALARNAANTMTVGTMRIEPGSGGGIALTYVASGVEHAESLQRFRMGNDAPACGWSVGAAARSVGKANYTSLWWDPEEPGWGLAVSHQGDTTFGTLFTYDGRNNPVWMVMSNGLQKSAGAFAGPLYRASRKSIQQAGSMSIAFDNANQGTLTYGIEGADVQRRITRMQFGALVSSCGPSASAP